MQHTIERCRVGLRHNFASLNLSDLQHVIMMMPVSKEPTIQAKQTPALLKNLDHFIQQLGTSTLFQSNQTATNSYVTEQLAYEHIASITHHLPLLAKSRGAEPVFILEIYSQIGHHTGEIVKILKQEKELPTTWQKLKQMLETHPALLDFFKFCTNIGNRVAHDTCSKHKQATGIFGHISIHEQTFQSSLTLHIENHKKILALLQSLGKASPVIAPLPLPPAPALQ